MGSVGVRVASSVEKVGRRGTAIPTNQIGWARSPFLAHYFVMGRVGVRATSSERKVGRRGTAIPTS